eukprot:1557661-Pleurochrysis_carterae.AAC.2
MYIFREACKMIVRSRCCDRRGVSLAITSLESSKSSVKQNGRAPKFVRIDAAPSARSKRNAPKKSQKSGASRKTVKHA